MKYIPVSSTLKMFQRFRLKYAETRSLATGRFCCLNSSIGRSMIAMPDSNKKCIPPQQVRYYSEHFQGRFQHIVKTSKDILTTTNLGEMRNAPTNYFWFNMLGAAAFIAPPVLSIVGGYSPLLTGLELGYAAAYLSFLGGMTWMHYVTADDVEWDRVANSILPPTIGIAGLLLPTVLGYPVIMTGMLVSLYTDIVCNIYPPWGNALRLFVTTVSVASMFLMLIGHILFG